MAKVEKTEATGNGPRRTFSVRDMDYLLDWPLTLKAGLTPGPSGVAPFADEASILTAANLTRNNVVKREPAVGGKAETKKNAAVAPTITTVEALQKFVDRFVFNAANYRARGTGKAKLPKIDPKTLVGKSEKEIAAMLSSMGYDV